MIVLLGLARWSWRSRGRLGVEVADCGERTVSLSNSSRRSSNNFRPFQNLTSGSLTDCYALGANRAMEQILLAHLRWGTSGLPKRGSNSLRIQRRKPWIWLPEFGKMDGRVSYQFAIWYDVIDSTSKRAKLSGEAALAYAARVRRFKASVSREVESLMIRVTGKGARLDVSGGGASSTDDEKHCFVFGSQALIWCRDIIRLLISCASRNGLAIRMLVLPADFAGIAAFKIPHREVDGEEFWAHLAQIKHSLKLSELEFGWESAGSSPSSSVVWVWASLADKLRVTQISEVKQVIDLSVPSTLYSAELIHRVQGFRIVTGSDS